MEDVARAAGVSGQTVSRVVNARGYVGAATRERVEAAMQSLGYRPNSAARALRSGRFRTIGVVMFSFSSYGNQRTLDAIAVRAAQLGYALTLIPVESSATETVAGAFRRLEEHAVDGIIIVIEAHQLDESDIEIPDALPVVFVDSNRGAMHPFVDTDQAQGARLATEHLLDLGHDTVWHVAGPAKSYSAERRREAWRATLDERGRVVPEPLQGDWSAASGYDAGVHLRQIDGVTAVFAANDQMAIGVLRAFREVHRDVPGDVSIVGFDGLPDAAQLWPPLTTVQQHPERVGALAVDALLVELDGGERGQTPLVGTELIVRASTAPPRSR
ncbi:MULTISPECIES: LacI family DNA-binding transcriptional regulator [unclassified Microbacterium]|uniref:LacI family DNA-binding transcriptional regulator n=1 Tax=unclassified Microbacterium TaxID=2609290 RepID=UPI000EAA8E28|nr:MULTISPECIES: LacI family DNA-binding transcriptional regulator [unclassified Microbacterium]MBT2485224.1 LacI family DNA-binding transcriptional regulator [Microbacterium sp. ISL-108]RKN69576.1 LacI family DNA-binding transcriptional regulator [Microbacterium sp. CGR2]